jgi:glycerol-3-phosphate acyltransferase PlsX
MRIVVDAMGSDAAPLVEVEGAAVASREIEHEIVLVGDEAVLAPELEKQGKIGNISIVHASERIMMDESPPVAVRRKKDSSMLVGMRLVRNGEADAFISAGSTGAVMISARAVLGPLRGVSRAAICQTLPTMTGRVSVLDLGANVNCTAQHLCEFGEMGIAYAQFALGVENPRVGLLNIGEEALKGTQVAKEVHRLMEADPHVNFVGNLEPKMIVEGAADVAICDGFVGNLFLKTSEAIAKFMGQMIKEEFTSSSMSKLGAMLSHRALKAIKERVDPNEYPGAPLLGINGLVLILHGSVTAKGVANAIKGAHVMHENKLNLHIQENIRELRQVERETADSAPAPEMLHTGDALPGNLEAAGGA